MVVLPVGIDADDLANVVLSYGGIKRAAGFVEPDGVQIRHGRFLFYLIAGSAGTAKRCAASGREFFPGTLNHVMPDLTSP
jgi:hypothetical protein